ncbi:lipoprotein-releasing ABC transporter ATP-binding protein LolD [Colwellia psychrerythraea]|uniref:Lipoprotein-releasing system ATP-binding protein LolD n=1 Tax=Colwellia psychrerythraea TaxID=28229 RepID=A0A099KZR8_COLPS|nr:lipoprotein-releasing ABC transporter ATP-binding protein LolD [Colwellia psychrerythraea]KGJ96091.1 lipoprotein releasing system, ATP-binding protein [Colwellia psychrerythraea]
MSKVLQCCQLSKSYKQGDIETKVLNCLELSVEKGELLAVVGSSGCGKSTFLHLAGALDSPSSGKVLINEIDIHQLSDKERAKFRNQHIGFIYQFHHLMMEFTALENVAMPLMIRGDKPKQALLAAKQMLADVGLNHRIDYRPSQLSGGERQRVAIARALVTKPSLVLADEPTGNLDSDTAEQIYQLIRSLNNTADTSFVIVTHDLVLANRMDRQVKLVQGQLLPLAGKNEQESSTSTVIISDPHKLKESDNEVSERHV